jgi:hypothetical protein
MVVIVDTCSLLALSKFYLPFDDEQVLYDFVETQYNARKFIIIDAIHTESRQTAKGIIIETLPFLENNKTNIAKTNNTFAPSPKRFSNQLDNNLCVPLAKKLLTETEYIAAKQDFLQTGDARLIIYALNYQKECENNLFEEFFVLTEESRIQNDGKLFKKLPLICEFLNIKTMTLPDYLKKNGIKAKWRCNP